MCNMQPHGNYQSLLLSMKLYCNTRNLSQLSHYRLTLLSPPVYYGLLNIAQPSCISWFIKYWQTLEQDMLPTFTVFGKGVYLTKNSSKHLQHMYTVYTC